MANTVTIAVDADTKTAESNVKGMSTNMTKAFKGVALAAAGITVAAGAAAKLGQEYQEATNAIRAGTGASGKQLKGLTSSFKNVASGVPQDMGAVASAIADVNTEMGLEGKALEDVTEAFLGVSRAMGEDASPMIKSVADSMSAFGVPAEDTRAHLDKLTAVSQAVGVPMSTLSGLVVKLAPQFQAMGFSLDEATALIGNMEASGLGSAKVMRGLNTAVKKLTDEGVTDIQGGLKDMIESIQNAETDADATTIAMDLFGESGLRFKNAIDKGVFSLDDMLAAMADSEDKVKDLGAATLTTSDKFDILKNRVKLALSPIGNFATALGPMVIMIPAMATAISAMAASQVVQTAVTWLQAAAMTALNLAFGPIGIAILAIVGAIILAIAIFKNWDKVVETFKETWDTIWNGIKSIFDTVMGALEKVFNSKLGWILPGGALIKALFFLRDNWKTIWNGMVSVVKLIANPIIGIINVVISAINGLLRAMNAISFGIAPVKVLGKTVIPGFTFDPFNFGMIPKIPKLAEGGIVRSPTLAMLGEAGPEAVVPLGRGGMGGGVTINILGPTYGFDDFEERVSEAISDGVRRGGYSGILAPA